MRNNLVMARLDEPFSYPHQPFFAPAGSDLDLTDSFKNHSSDWKKFSSKANKPNLYPPIKPNDNRKIHSTFLFPSPYAVYCAELMHAFGKILIESFCC